MAIYAAANDPSEVVADPQARYFGAALSEHTLVPQGEAILAQTRFSEWQGQASTRE